MYNVPFFQEDDDILSCLIPASHFCRLNTALHPIDHPQNCSFPLFKNDKAVLWGFSIESSSRQDNNLDKNFWVITMLNPLKQYITCLTYSYPQIIKYPLYHFLPN